MEGLNVLSDKFSIHHNGQDMFLEDMLIGNEQSGKTPQFIQKFIVSRVDDNNIELITCDAQEMQLPSQHILDVPLQRNPQPTELLSSSNLNFNSNISVRLQNKAASDIPFFRTSQQGQSVLKPINPPKILNHELFQTDKKMVFNDVTTYSCFKCREQFKSMTLFRQHLKWHKGDKRFNCTKCATGFNAENNLLIHMVTNHYNNTNSCPICKITFQRKASLKSHVLMHRVEELFLCEECQGEFQNDEELLKHMETHAITKVSKAFSNLLICSYCQCDFKTILEYKQHVAKHLYVRKNILKNKKVRKRRLKGEMEGGIQCRFCGKCFLKISLLERHERIHTGEKPFKCTVCAKAFAQKNTLIIHLDGHNGTKPYACTLCPAKFSQKGNLRAHVDKTHTVPKNGHAVYKCSQCTCIFTKLATLNGHVTKVHIEESSDEQLDVENIVDEMMDSLKDLHSGLGKSALKPNEVRPVEKAVSTSGTTLVRLTENHASGGLRRYIVRQKKIGDVRWYFCNYCSSRFKKPSDLIRHFRTHTMEKPYKCYKCSQAFSLKSTLINHQIRHQQAGKECGYCDISIKKSRNYYAHVRNHEKEKVFNYICLLCDKVFLNLEEGKEHRAIHKHEIQSQNIIEPLVKQPLYLTTYGSLALKAPKPKVPNIGTESPLERPHHCKICNARFTRLMSLKRHLMHHSGERKFRCSLCPKAFITRYRLREHVNYHSNIKNYGCQTCGKKFVTSSLLKRHTLIHNTVKPYMCPYCNKHFKTVLLCRAHINNAHQVEAAKEVNEKTKLTAENINKSSGNNRHNNTSFVAETISSQTNNLASKKMLTEHLDSPEEFIISQKSQEIDPAILNIATRNAQQDLHPEYQMVYLNIVDLPVVDDSHGILTNNETNLISSLKLEQQQHNDAYILNQLNDLQDSTVLFSIDTGKSEMVDPNEVLKSSAVGSNQALEENTSNLTSSSLVGTTNNQLGGTMGSLDASEIPVISSLTSLSDELTNGEQDLAMQGFSAVELDGIPISIVGASDSTAMTPSLVDGEIIPYDAPVLCINCSKMFADYDMFQNHACADDSTTQPQDNIKLLLQQGIDNHVEKLLDSEYLYDNIEVPIEENKTPRSESYENRDLSTSPIPNSKFDLYKMKKFTYKKNLLKDIEKMEQLKQFSCDSCDFVTSIADKYRKHLLSHSNKICRFCCKDFKKVSDLKRHLRTHTGEKPFECDLCHKKFTLKSTLESHLRTHEIPGLSRIVCDVCNSRFTSKSSLKVHMLIHTGARPHACTYCEQTFRTLTSRKVHEKSVHLTKNNQSARKQTKLGGLKQTSKKDNVRQEAEENQKTDLSSVTQTALLINTGTDSISLDPMIIQIPNSGFVITPGVDESVPINLGNITLLDVIDESQVVDIGPQINIQESDVPNNNYRKSASKLEQRPAKVQCDICLKLYASKDVLRKHKKALHGQNKKFPCIKCDKGYDQLEDLNQHIAKLHTGSRPYSCQYCSNSFSDRSSLKTHIKRIHQKAPAEQETTNAILSLQYNLSGPVQII